MGAGRRKLSPSRKPVLQPDPEKCILMHTVQETRTAGRMSCEEELRISQFSYPSYLNGTQPIEDLSIEASLIQPRGDG